MLLSIYNAVGWVEISEYEASWQTDFPLIDNWARAKKTFSDNHSFF